MDIAGIGFGGQPIANQDSPKDDPPPVTLRVDQASKYTQASGATSAKVTSDVLSRTCVRTNSSADVQPLLEIIRQVRFTMKHNAMYSHGSCQKTKEINGNLLLEGRYNLAGNCINTCMPLMGALNNEAAIRELHYRVCLSVISEPGDDADVYFESSDISKIPFLVANSYLVFEHTETSKRLMFDPTVGATLLTVKPDLMTFADMKAKIRSTLEQHRSYPSICISDFIPYDVGCRINQYIFDEHPEISLEATTNLLFNALYGENMNPNPGVPQP